MLELRSNCECCNRALPPATLDARICSFECTFCADCAEGVLRSQCPNCGGELLRRPIRPANKLVDHPASTQHVLQPQPCVNPPHIPNTLEKPPLSVYLIVTPGVLLLDYAGPAEALRMARDMGAALTLHTCGPQTEVHTSLGPQLAGLEPLPAALAPNSLVLVTGNSQERENYTAAAGQEVVRWLQTAPGPDTRLASICSGALLLAMAGQLDGLRCTTHHSLLADLQNLAPNALVESDRIFVDSGRVLTSAGVTTGIDLALYVVEQTAGAALAARVARRLVMYLRRGPHEPQLSPWLAHRNHMHPAVHRVQDALTENMVRDPQRRWSLPELAALACVSPRHLSRLFVQHTGISVLHYQQQLRVARAQELLAQTPRLSQEQLADACGLGSARDFRRLLQRSRPKPANH